MTRCNRCQVSVSDDHVVCPLCQQQLNETGTATAVGYPRYLAPKINKSLRVKIWLYFTIILCTVAIAGNLLTWHLLPLTWAPTVSLASLYLWLVGKDLYIDFNLNMMARTLWKNYYFLTFLLIIIDLSTGFHRWSLDYAIPFLGIGTGLIMTIVSMINKSVWRDDIGYILLTVSINIIPLLIFMAKGTTILWPSLASLLYGGIIIVGLIIFSGKRLLYELQKRFHF